MKILITIKRSLYYIQMSADLVYKSCQRNYIIALRKLEDTITNEDRSNITDPRYAMYRANKLLVEQISHKITGQEVQVIYNGVSMHRTSECSAVARAMNLQYTAKVCYRVGEEVSVDDYDMIKDNVCSTGIHYFLSEEAAKLYDIPDDYTGRYKAWRQDGELCLVGQYLNGKKHGSFREYMNGQLIVESEYNKEGMLHGDCKIWYMVENNNNTETNRLRETRTYVDGLRHGIQRMWYRNGQMQRECMYLNDRLDGNYIEWTHEGNVVANSIFKEGHLLPLG